MPRIVAPLRFGAGVKGKIITSPGESMARLAIVRQALKHGLRATILGFSFNAQPNAGALAAIRDLSGSATLCVRDPESLRRLARLGVGHLTAVADVAFLMPPAAEPGATLESEQWIAAQRARGRRVAIVNFSGQVLAAAPRDPPFLETFAQAIAELVSSEGLSVLLVPHDLRQAGKSDVAIAMELAQRLKASAATDCRALFIPSAADEVKRLAGQVDFVITGRMHLAIAALGMGTPAICLEYQGKFSGLLEVFEIEDLLISPSAFEVRDFQQKCTRLMNDIEAVSNRVKMRLPHVVELARSNFLHLSG